MTLIDGKAISEQVKQEIDWIISTTNEDITIARCNMILSLLEDK